MLMLNPSVSARDLGGQRDTTHTHRSSSGHHAMRGFMRGAEPVTCWCRRPSICYRQQDCNLFINPV